MIKTVTLCIMPTSQVLIRSLQLHEKKAYTYILFSDMLDGKPLKDAKGKEYRLIEGEFTWDEAGKACWVKRAYLNTATVYLFCCFFLHKSVAASLP